LPSQVVRVARDIAGILKISREEVDIAYITEWSGRLGLTDIWETILQTVDESG